MSCAGFSPELYDLYALGALEHEEASGIEDHLRTNCITCEEQIHGSLERAASLALAVSSIAPPRALRARIVASVTPPRAARWSFLSSPALAWTMAATCLVVGASLTYYLGQSRQQVSQLRPPVVTVPAPSAPAPVAANPAAPARNTPAIPSTVRPSAGESAVGSTLNASISQQRERIAQLEADLRTKDAQLASSQLQLQVAQSRPAPSQDNGALENVRRELASTQQRVDELTRQVRFYQTAIQSQRGELDRNVQLISLLSSPTLRVLDLRATEQGGAASGRALLAGNAQILFYASSLPPLPAGRTYQLWVMRNRGPAVVSGGIFQPDQRQSAVLTVPNANLIANITALAVTEEPAGGQPLPTGHKILFGSVRT